MVAWGDTKGKASDTQRREILRLKLGDSTKVRLIGSLLPRYVYWVVTNEGKKYPVECLRFDRNTETFDDTVKDPMQEVPTEIYSEKPQFAYVCNVLNRADNQIYLFDVKVTIYKQIVELARDSDYGDPANPESGYDITIKREKTGPLTQNVRYHCTPGRASTPLTDVEKALELYNLDAIFKRPTYVEQKKWLLEHTAYFAGTAGDEFKDEVAEDI